MNHLKTLVVRASRAQGSGCLRHLSAKGLVGLVLMLVWCCAPALAATVTWDAGSATDLNWSTNTNWSTDAAPGTGDDILLPTPIPNPGFLPSSSIITLTAAAQVNTLQFDDSYTLTGSTLALTNGTIGVASGMTGTISSGLTGAWGLTKTGAGVLVLSGGNTGYSGLISVNQGTLSASSDANLGTNAALTLNGGTLQTTGTTAFASAKSITLAADGTIEALNTAGSTISGNITGSFKLTKTGSEKLLLRGTNTFANGLFVNQGLVDFNADTQLGAASVAVTLNGGGLSYSGNTTHTLARDINIAAGSNSTIDIATAYSGGGKMLINADRLKLASGTATLNKTGPGALQITVDQTTFNGAWNVTGGFLEVSSSTALGMAGTTVTVGGTGELVAGNTILSNAITLNNGGTISGDNGNSTYSGPLTASNKTLVTDKFNVSLKDFYQNTARNLTLSGSLSGPVAGSHLDMNVTANAGAATLILTGNNTAYTGSAIANGNANIEYRNPSTMTGVTLNGGTMKVAFVGSSVASAGVAGINALYMGFGSDPGGINSDRWGTDQLITSPARSFSRIDSNTSIIWSAGTNPYGVAPSAFFPATPVTGLPTAGLQQGVLWKGLLNVTAPGDYTFYAGADDPGALYIDGVLVASPGVTEIAYTTALTAGAHSIVFKHYNNAGGGGGLLAYSGADTTNIRTVLGTGASAGKLTTGSMVAVGWNKPISLADAVNATTSTLDTAADLTITGAVNLGANTNWRITSPTLSTVRIASPSVITITGTLNGATISPTTADLIIETPITESGFGRTLTLSGTNRTTFRASNTYTGMTTVTGGELDLDASTGNAIGVGGLTVNVPLTATGIATANVKLLRHEQINNGGSLALLSGTIDINGKNETIDLLQLSGGSLVDTVGTGVINASAVDLRTGVVTARVNFTGTLTKQDDGVLVVGGTQTYSGNTVVERGIFRAASNTALGTGAGVTQVGQDGVLELAGGITTNESVELTYASISGTPNLRNYSGNNTLTQKVIVSGWTMNIGSNAGTLNLNGSTAVDGSSFWSDVTFSGGGRIRLGGAVDLGGFGNIYKAGTGTLIFATNQSAFPVQIANWLDGAIGFEGTQSFGAFAVPAGRTLYFGSDPGAGVDLTVDTGSTIIADYVTPATLLSRVNTASSGGQFVLTGDSAAALDFSSRNLSLGASTPINYSGTITPHASGYKLGASIPGGRLTVDSVLSGTSAVGINGEVQLAAVNTFTGNVTVNNGGVLYVRENRNLGTATNTVTLNDGGTLRIYGPTGGGFNYPAMLGNIGTGYPAAPRTINVAAGATGTLDVPSALGTGNQTFWLTGANQLTAGSTASTLVKSGLGYLVVGNSQNFAGKLVLATNSFETNVRGLGKFTSLSGLTINPGSVFMIDSQNTPGPRELTPASMDIADRFGDSTPVTLAGGELRFRARNITFDATKGSKEAFGTVTTGLGQSLLRTERTGGGGGDLYVTNLVHNVGGGTLRIVGDNTIGAAGDNGRIILGQVNGSVPTDNSWLPAWVVINASDFGVHRTQNAAGAAGGVVLPNSAAVAGTINYSTLTTTTAAGGGNWTASIYGNADADVTTLGTPGAAQNFNVGALRFLGAATKQILFANTTNTDTLYIQSGGILSDGNNNARNIGTNTLAAARSRLTAGATTATTAQELFLHNNSNTMTIFSQIIDNPNNAAATVALIKDLDGTVSINPIAVRASTNIAANSVVTLPSTADLTVGMRVSGNGVPAGTTIFSIDSGTAITLSNPVTAANTNANFTYNFDNTYSGGTYVLRGTLDAPQTGSLGKGAVTIKNAQLNLGTFGAVVDSPSAPALPGPVYTTIDQSTIVLGNGNTNILGSYTAATDRFSLSAGSTIYANSPGAFYGFNSLTRVAANDQFTGGGQIYLAPDAIVKHNMTNAPDQGTGILTIQNLGTNADLYFAPGNNPGVAATLTVGASTPWKGLSSDRGDTTWQAGTIFANSDFYLQGLVRDGGRSTLFMGNPQSAGSYAIVNNAGKPINAYIVGGVTLNEDVPVSLPSDLTFVVTTGSSLLPNYSNSLGSNGVYAKVRVLSGGTLDPGNFVPVGLAANQPVGVAYPVPGPLNGATITIENGGRLLANDASGLGSSTGVTTFQNGATLHLANQQALLGTSNTQFAFQPGSIVRYNADNIYLFNQSVQGGANKPSVIEFVANQTVNSVRDPSKVGNFYPANAYAYTLDDFTLYAGQTMTNDTIDRTINNGYGGRIILNNGAAIAATSGTFLNISDDIYVPSGATVTIGNTSYINGLAKEGTVQLQGAHGNRIDGTVTVADGAMLSFGAQNVWQDGKDLDLPIAVNTAGITPGAFVQPNNGSTLLLNTANFSEVIGKLTGNGMVLANQDNTVLGMGYGQAGDWTYSGVFSNLGSRQPNLQKLGTTKMTISGVNTSTGNMLVVQGTASISGAGSTAFNQYWIGKGATLEIDNTATAAPNRLGGTGKSVWGEGGTLLLKGNATTSVTEALADLRVDANTSPSNNGLGRGGISTVQILPGAAATTLQFTNIQNFGNTGASNQWIFKGTGFAGLPGSYGASGTTFAVNPANPTNGLFKITGSANLYGVGGGQAFATSPAGPVGGTGFVGTSLVPTRPDLYYDGDGTGRGTMLMTIDNATTGLRPLADSEFANRIWGQGTRYSNIKLAAGVHNVAGDAYVNSLVTAPGTTINVTGNRFFTPAPARLLFYNPVILAQDGGTTTINGYIERNDGNTPFYFHTLGDLVINGSMRAGYGFIKSGPGTLTFGDGAAKYTYNQQVIVNDGTVVLGNNNAFVPIRQQYQPYGVNLTINGGTFNLGNNMIYTSAFQNSSRIAGMGGTLTGTAGGGIIVSGGGYFSGNVSGPLTLVKHGGNNLTLTGLNDYTGATQLRSGVLQLVDDGRISSTSALDMYFSQLQFDNTYMGNRTDRVNTAASMSMRGSRMTLLGGGPGLSSQAVATTGGASLSLTAGANEFNVQPGNGGSSELTVGNLVRTPGASMFVTTGNSGLVGGLGNTSNAARLILNNIGGTAPALVNDILPAWITVNGSDFATYIPGQGVVALGQTDMGAKGYAFKQINVTTLYNGPAGATENVSIGGSPAAINEDLTLNSLRVTGGATVTIAANKTLTLASGGLLTNVNAAVAIGSAVNQGFVTSGNSELNVYVNQSTTTFNSVVKDGPSGTTSLVKAGGQTLVLAGYNTYTGGTFVNHGTLTAGLAGTTYNGTTQVAVPGDVLITGTAGGTNATLSIAVANAIKTTANITIEGGGTLNILNGVNTTISSIILKANGGGTANGLTSVTSPAAASTSLTLTSPTPITSSVDNSATINTFGANVGTLNFLPSSGTTATINAFGNVAGFPHALGINSIIGTVPSGGLLKTGAGMMSLGGANTFGSPATLTDVLTINEGIVRADVANALGSSINANTVVNNGGVLLGRNSVNTIGSIRLNTGATIAPTENVWTIGTTAAESNLNVAGNATLDVYDYFLPVNNTNVTLTGKLTGAGTLTIQGSELTAAGDFILNTPTPANATFSGTLIVKNGARLLNTPSKLGANAGATGSAMGTGTVALQGGTLYIRDDGNTTATLVSSPINYPNPLSISANSILDIDRIGGSSTANQVTFPKLTVNAGTSVLTLNAGNNYVARMTQFDGTGTVLKSGGGTLQVVGFAGGSTPGVGLAGPMGLTIQQANGGLDLYPTGAASAALPGNLVINGYYATIASKSLSVAGTFEIGNNAGAVGNGINGINGIANGGVVGAVSLTNSTTLSAVNFKNNGNIGASGGAATVTVTGAIQGSGHYQTLGQQLTIAGGSVDGIIKVAGDNTVLVTPSLAGGSNGAAEVQSGTLRVFPSTAAGRTNPLGNGTQTIKVLGSAATSAGGTNNAVAAINATLNFDPGAGNSLTQAGNIQNSGIVRAATGIVEIGGNIAGPGANAYTAGLLEGRLNTGTAGTAGAYDDFNATRPVNTGTFGVRLEPRLAQTNVKPSNALLGWGDNETWVYTGQIKVPAGGKLVFAENIDDNAYVAINGNVVLYNPTAATPASSAYTTGNTGSGTTAPGTPQTVTAGLITNSTGSDQWYNIELRFRNGTGGAGPTAANGWANNFGFGINFTGEASLRGDSYYRPIDDGSMSLFRTPINATGNLSIDPGAELRIGGTLANIGDVTINGTAASAGLFTMKEKAALGTSSVTNLKLVGTGALGTVFMGKNNLLTVNTLLDVPTGTTLTINSTGAAPGVGESVGNLSVAAPNVVGALNVAGAQLTVTGTSTGAGTYTVSGGRLKVSGSILAAPGVTLSSGVFEAAETQKVKAINATGGTVEIGLIDNATGYKVLTATSLSLTGSSKMQLHHGGFILDYTGSTPAATIRSLITTGRGLTGLWDGATGITSSVATALPLDRAVGYAEASNFASLPATFMGAAIPDNTSLLVRLTVKGDATLDGIVNFDDLVQVAQNYESGPGKTWYLGDFNYDGAVTFDDLVDVAQHYETGLPGDIAAAVPGASASFTADWARAQQVAVPEPGVLSLLAIGSLMMLRRNRKAA